MSRPNKQTPGTKPRLSPKQLLEIFPEGKAIINRLVRENSDRIKHVKQSAIETLRNEKYDSHFKAVFKECVWHLFLAGLYKEEKRLKTYLAVYSDKPGYSVTAAKQVPIEHLYAWEKPMRTAKRIVCRCPFHDEKTGSFVVYRQTNTFHCFGCQKSGDSIDFIMQLNKMNFKEAVRYLNNHG